MDKVIAAALVAVSLFGAFGLLKAGSQHRPLIVGLLGFLLLVGGAIKLEVTFYSWPMWQGGMRGIGISPREGLALALLFTRRRPPKLLPFWGLIAFYVAAESLSLLFAFKSIASAFGIWSTLRGVLIFVALGGELADPRLRRAFLAGLGCGLLLNAGYVLQQRASGILQATGTIGHQNAMGMLVELTLMPLIAALLAGDRRKIIYAGVAGAMVIIAAGGSRGTMGFCFGGILALLILSMIRGVTPRKNAIVGAALAAMLVTVPVGYLTLQKRFNGGPMIGLDIEREAFKRAALMMAADHPFGAGVNNYVAVANTQGYNDKAGVHPTASSRSAPAHNAYLLTRAEMGWLGEIALVLLLCVPTLRALRFAFQNRRSVTGEIVLGAGVALTLNIIHNNYEFAVTTYGLQLPVFAIVALVAAELRAAALAKRFGPRPARPNADRQVQKAAEIGPDRPPFAGHRPAPAAR